MSFTFAYPSGANISFNVYVWSISFSFSYWYSPSIVSFPVLSVMYSPTSSIPLYNLNFAPSKYVTSVFANAVSAFAISLSSFTALSVVFFIFVISKSYVGIFSSSNVIFSVGILSSSVIWCSTIFPSSVSNT